MRKKRKSNRIRKQNRRRLLRAESLENRRLLAADFELHVQVVQVCDDAGSNCAALGPSGDTNPASPNEYLYESQVNDIFALAGIEVNFSIVTWNNTAATQLSNTELNDLFNDTWSVGTAPPAVVDGLQFFFTSDHPGTGYDPAVPGSGWVANPLPDPNFFARNAGIAELGIMDPMLLTNGRGVMANEGFAADSISGTLPHEIAHGLGLRHIGDPEATGTVNDPIVSLPDTEPNLLWETGDGPAYNFSLTVVENNNLVQSQIDAMIANGTNLNFDPDGNGEAPLKAIVPTFTVTVSDDELDSTSPTATIADFGGENDLSLREAIVLANQDADEHRIEFNIPGSGNQIISLTSPLPALSTTIVIDAKTQSGYTEVPVVGIDGSSAGASAAGFQITADNVVIEGLAIYGFSRDGVEIRGDSATLRENHIGLNLSEVAMGNFNGVRIVASEFNVLDKNVISGNNRSGVFVSSAETGGNTFINNKIGTNSDGDSERPNATDGLTLFAANNTVGTPGAGNLISGNDRSGIYLHIAGRGGNTVQGNIIGLDITGTTEIPNLYGLHIRNQENIIGGADTDQNNAISGNDSHGIVLSSSSAYGNDIKGNLIGTDLTGNTAIGNFDGIHIVNSPNNTIGGTGANEANVISGNDQRGIFMVNAGTTGNNINGNRIGVGPDGTTTVPNNGSGIRIAQGPSNNTIYANIISGNNFGGVTIDSANSTGNDILFNAIGTDATGTIALHNGNRGAVRVLAPDTTVQGNYISDDAHGVLAFRDASGIQITDNLIGGTGSTFNNGIRLITGADDASISGNQITNTTTAVSLTNVQRATILDNHIFGNGFGIDLNADGVTANDPGDGDAGANGRQNNPEISAAISNGGLTNVDYRVDTTDTGSNYPITIEFFTDDGSGQGGTRIAVDTYEAAYAGAIRSIQNIGGGLLAGDRIVATATDANGNTSEFGVSFTVTS